MKPKLFQHLVNFFMAAFLFATVANAETQSVTLSSDLRRSSAFGLEFEYVGQLGEGAEIEVFVECLAEEATPELTLGSSTGSSSEKLINTTSSSSDCASFKISTSAVGAAVRHINFGIATDGIATQSLGPSSIFIFNAVEGNWTKAEAHRPNQNDPTKAYTTLTEQTVQAISGLVVSPDLPTSEPFSPQSLSETLESVDPLQGLLHIQRPNPNTTGQLSVELPLLLRPSRGPGPSFKITNSSAAGVGVLGRGWGLQISSIQVRGPSPIYHPDFETEDYLLDGQELIALDADGKEIPPLYKGGPILPRVDGVRVFRPRNATQPLIIRRYGSGPDGYFWEVWNPGNRVTQLFGAVLDGTTIVEDTQSQSVLTAVMPIEGTTRSVSGKWGISQEFDNQPARSGARYTYHLDDACDTTLPVHCSQNLRIKRITYNEAFSHELSGLQKSGVTNVDFIWSPRSKERFITNARLGFLVANQHWLSDIEVHYPAGDDLLWLTGQELSSAANAENILYARHSFDLSAGDNACMNFERVLSSVTVEANPIYDTAAGPTSTANRDLLDGAEGLHDRQVFEFSYVGQDDCPDDNILVWDEHNLTNPLQAEDASSGIGFPDGLLSSLGLDVLTQTSLLGESNTDETGASIYVGIGPVGDTSDKAFTGGIKAGLSFIKSRGGSTLIDVTGDGIADVLMRTSNGLKYCAATRAPDGTISYRSGTECGNVHGLNDIAISSSSTQSFGVEGYHPVGFFGVGHNSASSNTYVYPTDRDGDGLTDFAVYGRVLYGQGETCPTPDTCFVQFSSESALTPPLPGQNGEATALLLLENENRKPPGFAEAIDRMRQALDGLRKRLDKLSYSQTSIAWQVPLAGAIQLEGQFELDATAQTPDGDKLVANGLRDFPGLRQRALAFDQFINDCSEFPELPHCPNAVPAGHTIFFPSTPAAVIRLDVSRSRKGTGNEYVEALETCGALELPRGENFSLADLLTTSTCARTTDLGPVLDVEAGDVLYLTYSVHPDFTGSLLPGAQFEYRDFKPFGQSEPIAKNRDPTFDMELMHGNFDVRDVLSCTWRDQFPGSTVETDCLLNKQNRYTHSLANGFLSANASANALIPKSSKRAISGTFLISRELTQDYQIYLDLKGLPQSRGNIRAADLPVVLQQDITNTCSSGSEALCEVNLNLICQTNQATCDGFFADDAEPWRISLSLKIEHVQFPGRLAKNTDGRLTSLNWRAPPRLTTEITEVTPSTPQPPYTAQQGSLITGTASKTVAFYLPIAAGSEDLEYRRIEHGKFVAPNDSLNEGSPNLDEIDLSKIIDDEISNVSLTRGRQLARLCGFAAEIINFLELRDTSSTVPFAPSRVEFWREKLAPAQLRCGSEELDIQGLDFTNRHRPELDPTTERLRLSERLKRLPLAEQISSAETLLVRVLKNLELPKEVLTSHPNLGRQGYRLPMKANPLDCELILATTTPVDSAIYGEESPCRYRVLMNFAMESILNLFPDLANGDPHPKRLAYEEILAPLLASEEAAFDLELAITVNGKPVVISELSGSAASSITGKTGHIPPGSVLKDTCIGRYGAHSQKAGPPTHYYPNTETIGGSPGSTIFQRIVTNRRSGRAVAFSDDVMHTTVPGTGSELPHGLGNYSSLFEMEAKQDCAEVIDQDQVYVGSPSPSVAIQILENNHVDGRNRIFEFEARPLDVVEFQVRLKPRLRQQPYETTSPENINFELDGKFSVLEVPPQGPAILPREEFIIPRSPSQILPPNLDQVDCGENSPITNLKLLRTCRPWTRLAWSELLLGAEYRTYSDAHKTLNDKEFSIKRRRDLLRVFPEIQIGADEFRLETDSTIDEFAPIAGNQYVDPATAFSIGVAERIVEPNEAISEDRDVISRVEGLGDFISEFSVDTAPRSNLFRISYAKVREPSIHQIGDAWLFWAQKSKSNGDLVTAPVFGDLRFQRSTTARPPADPRGRYNQAKAACLNDAGSSNESPNFQGCEDDTKADGEDTLNFQTVDLFPLLHRFIGPVHETEQNNGISQLIAETDICAVPTASSFASCWSGPDYTVFFHQKIPAEALNVLDQGENKTRHTVRSVSAFIGLEQPLIEQFQFELDALMRIACNDASAPAGFCSQLSISPGDSDAEKYSGIHAVTETPDTFVPLAPNAPKTSSTVGTPVGANALVRAPPAVPNRPRPPDPSSALHVFAPIQGSGSQSVSLNGGTDISGISFNANKVFNESKTTSLFIDINGDGFPEHLSGDGTLSGPLTSPVGLLRRDWWQFFKSSTHPGAFGSGQNGSGYVQDSKSNSEGAGFGLSPPTFAQIYQKSIDAVVSPSFNLSFESGRQTKFTDLKDFNGDGILDVLDGSNVNGGVGVKFNLGNSVASRRSAIAVCDPAAFPQCDNVIIGADLPDNQPYNTTHSTGFGIRLGFSINSGSIMGGMGLGTRVQGSDGVLMDFNGDGRVDIVIPIEASGKSYLAVFPNVGNGFVRGRLHQIESWAGSETSVGETTLVDAGGAFTFGFNALYVKVVFNPAVKKANNQSRELLSVRDVNGDGFPDLARVSGVFNGADSSGKLIPDFSLPGSIETTFNYNPDATYHLLSGIVNPTRVEQQVSYALHGNTGPELGRTIWVVDSVSEFDGFAPGHATDIYADGQDIRMDMFAYRDGYFNRAEKAFYGFSEVTQRTFGCDMDGSASTNCPAATLVEKDITAYDYVLLQERLRQSNNRDYLTKGTVIAELVAAPSETRVLDASVTTPILQSSEEMEISHARRTGFVIEHLSSLGTLGSPTCGSPGTVQARWDHGQFSDGSVLPTKWSSAGEQNVAFDGGPALGLGSICSSGLRTCHAELIQQTCESGFWLEQTQFWAQQSGSARERFSDLQILAPGTDFPAGSVLEDVEIDPETALYSAAAADFDQWGQRIKSYSIGDIDIADNPISVSSFHTLNRYADLNGLSLGLQKAAGQQDEYPILSLPLSEEVFAGPWPLAGSGTPIRMREAIFQEQESGRGTAANMTDICQYPVRQAEPDFNFRYGICEDFKASMRRSLSDGLSSLIDAQEVAFLLQGLPSGSGQFRAIQHSQINFDNFGNPIETISPLNDEGEWLEHKYAYDQDAFVLYATEIKSTRCVEDGIGVGSSSIGATSDTCGFNVGYSSPTEERIAITHLSERRVDTHHGALSGSKDANENRILIDLDRWGRFRLLARDWGTPPRQNRAFREELEFADRKQSFPEGPQPWNILAVANYGWPVSGPGTFSSHTQMFASSDAYVGATKSFDATRNAAEFKDGLGSVIQARTEAEVCDGANSNLLSSINSNPNSGLADSCVNSNSSRVSVGGFTDVHEREFASFEGYAEDEDQNSIGAVFRLPTGPATKSIPIVTRSFDSGGRQTLEQHRLALESIASGDPGVRATKQFAYSVESDKYAGHLTRRFRTASLSPRCALTISKSDPRGLSTDAVESQSTLYNDPGSPAVSDINSSDTYARDYIATLGFCDEIETALTSWTDDERPEARAEVNYLYDPLLQLVEVEYPLAGSDRAKISVEYDRFGRMVQMSDPDSGCTRYSFDNLSNLVEKTGSAYDSSSSSGCGPVGGSSERRIFEYSADRVIAMSYRSLLNKGGLEDVKDRVQFFYDRLPHTTEFGELLEAPRVVPNEHANQRFFDVTGKICENCIGQLTLVSDRTGARSYNFTELGQVKKETRSIVAPVTDVDPRQGTPEDFLPEVAFYELENSYSSFGDITLQEFNESVPSDPSSACLGAGPETCVARFSIGTRYAPDGSVAALLFNDQQMILSARDDLNRPSVRLMSDGTVTGFFYDPVDLKLNEMATITAATSGGLNVPVQITGYQYDGGGNIHAYQNVAEVSQEYRSHFNLGYDGANRLIGFDAFAQKRSETMTASGAYGFDLGHRITSRDLSIEGDPGSRFTRRWNYFYDNAPAARKPVHAPNSIAFTVPSLEATRVSALEYDDVGRLAKVRAAENGSTQGVLSNRRLDWDGAGRLKRVLGGPDEYWANNEDYLDEEYIYDFAGNRVLKIHRPVDEDDGEKAEHEFTSIYMTPFYSRPADERGTVQLASGDLPVASLKPPVSETAEPMVNYLYPDLAVGTITASVLAAGEISSSDDTLIARREFSPFGLELTANRLASPEDPLSSLPSAFHGKELDQATGFSSFGARYYSRDLGFWASPDPAMYIRPLEETGFTVNRFLFVNGNPVSNVDPDGAKVYVISNINEKNASQTGLMGRISNAAAGLIGVHTSLMIVNEKGPNLIYDPGGSYHSKAPGMGSGDALADEDAKEHFAKFLAYQIQDGENVMVQSPTMTPAEEQKLYDTILEQGGGSGGMCTTSCVNALRNSADSLKNLGGITPKGLYGNLKKLGAEETSATSLKSLFRKKSPSPNSTPSVQPSSHELQMRLH